jgi:site-specific recombinase XerD
MKQHNLWLESFLSNCAKLNKSHHTIKNYRCDLEKYIYWFEATQRATLKALKLNNADAQTIEQYKDYLDGVPFKTRKPLHSYIFFWKKRTYPEIIKQTPLSIGSKKRHLSAIKNFYEYLVQANQGRNKLFLDNPVKSKLHSIRLKDADINHTKLLTPGQWETLCKNLHHPKEKLIGHLLYYGGLRLEELTRLQISDFSQRNKSLSFIRKGGQLHSIKLQEFDMIFDLLLKSLTSANHACGYVFVNRFGNPISTRGMYQVIKKLLKRSGLQSYGLGPHSFRKACATNMYLLTKDILLVRNYLNHKDAKVTQTYIDY